MSERSTSVITRQRTPISGRADVPSAPTQHWRRRVLINRDVEKAKAALDNLSICLNKLAERAVSAGSPEMEVGLASASVYLTSAIHDLDWLMRRHRKRVQARIEEIRRQRRERETSA